MVVQIDTRTERADTMGVAVTPLITKYRNGPARAVNTCCSGPNHPKEIQVATRSVQQRRKPVEQRFWEKTRIEGSCLMWTAYTDRKGYGRFHLDGRTRQAHQVAYEMTRGPIPEGVEIDHICHNPGCVNPEHLRLATGKQNRENRRFARGESSSRGVYKHRNKWCVRVMHNGKNHYFGLYSDKAQAARVAREARNSLFTHNVLDRTAPDSEHLEPKDAWRRHIDGRITSPHLAGLYPGLGGVLNGA